MQVAGASISVFFTKNSKVLTSIIEDPLLRETSAGKLASNKLYKLVAETANSKDHASFRFAVRAFHTLLEAADESNSRYYEKLLARLMNENRITFDMREEAARALADKGCAGPFIKRAFDTYDWATMDNAPKRNSRKRFWDIAKNAAVKVSGAVASHEDSAPWCSDAGWVYYRPKNSNYIGKDTQKWEMLKLSLELLSTCLEQNTVHYSGILTISMHKSEPVPQKPAA